MSYRGDIRLGDTIDFKFSTRQASGAPTTLAGTPVISAYVGNSVTQLTAGITLTVDFDAVTGLHNVRVVASGANGYATASNYDLVITTGTVNAVSVVGEVIGSFSIEARSAVMPTTAARTLDVSATGEAGVDWANVGSPTTALALTGTTIATTQKVDVETIKTNPVVNAGTITFPTTATLASTTNVTAATGIVLSGVTHTGAVIPTVTALTGHTAQTGDNFARLGAPAGLSVSADIAAAKVDTAAVKVKTDFLPSVTAGGTGGVFIAGTNAATTITTALTTTFTGALTGSVGSVTGAVGSVTSGVTVTTNNDKTGYTLTAADHVVGADTLLDRDMATGTDSGSPTVRTVRQALRFLRNKWSIAAGTLTVRKENDTDPSWTSVVTTDAAAVPIIGSDPA